MFDQDKSTGERRNLWLRGGESYVFFKIIRIRYTHINNRGLLIGKENLFQQTTQDRFGGSLHKQIQYLRILDLFY